MNNSASRFNDHQAAASAEACSSTLQLADRHVDYSTITSVLKCPVSAQPLLTLQRLAMREIPVVCVCDDFRAAQRYFCEAVNNDALGGLQPFIVHEMMPGHHQDYVFDNLSASRDFSVACNVALFTTQEFYATVCERLEWLNDVAQVITTSGNGDLEAAPVGLRSGEATVSCICLRTGAGGRWVLMDHDDAAVVHADQAPSADLVRRLLRHTVNISGNRLAPYLAMMFDVPQAWKVHPELAVQSLLVFNQDVCNLACYQPGIPQRIIWNDLLGIVYEG